MRKTFTFLFHFAMTMTLLLCPSLLLAQTAHEEVLVNEDFSLMTGDSTEISDDDTWAIPDAYFHTPGWTGEGIYTANGTVGLSYPGYGGVLNTPLGDYHGKITIRFKAKATRKNGNLVMVSINRGGIKDLRAAAPGFLTKTIKGTDTWTEVEWTAVNPYPDTDAFVQINASNYDGGIFVDSLVVTRDLDYQVAPLNLAAGAFTHDGFTAAWDKTPGAADYVVNLYETTTRSDNQKDTETFEACKFSDDGATIDPATLPKGWEFDFVPDSAQLATSGDGTQGILFSGDVNDNYTYLSTPEQNYKILDFSFDVKKLSENSDGFIDDGYTTYLEILGWNGNNWDYLGMAEMDGEVGSTKTFTMDDFTEYGEVAGLYSRLKIAGGYMDTGSLVLDNFYIEREPAKDTTLVQGNIVTTDNYYTFTGLDMTKEKYFTVTARNANGVASVPTTPFHALGLAAPVASEATDVTPTSFTANWSDETQANDGYIVSLSQKYTAPEAVSDYSILCENFDKVTKGTVKKPAGVGNNSNATSMDDFTHRSGWLGYGSITAKGMLGCRQSSYGSPYCLITPELSLGGGDKSAKVSVIAFNDQADTLVIQNSVDYVKVAITPGDTNVVNVTLPNCKDGDRIYFYTANHTAFLLDSVSVTQDLLAGDIVVVPLSETKVAAGETSYTFSDLDPAQNFTYVYHVEGVRTVDDETAYSDASNDITVDLTTGIATLRQQQPADRRIYDLMGRSYDSKAQLHKGIYIINGRKVIVK